MSETKRTSVFISYSGADRALVERLVEELRADFDVFYDEDIQPGRSWMEQLEMALNQSDAGVIVLSPDSVNSGAVMAERTVLHQRYWSEQHPLIPVLYRGCQVPPLLSSLQYIVIADESHEALQEAIDKLRDALRGHTAAERPRPSMSLRVAWVLFLLVILTPLCIMGVRAYHLKQTTFNSLHNTQRAVQDIDARVNFDAGYNSRSLDHGELNYFDPQTGDRLTRDTWRDGRLEFRDFYRDDHLLARDTFIYSGNNIITEKIRTYMDDDHKVYLIDYFTQGGVLTKKRFCSEGPEAPCAQYIDDMRSPLPPAAMASYR